MKRIIIFGTGSVSDYIFNQLDLNKVDILAFVNSSDTINEFKGKKVISPDKIATLDYDYVLIASGYVNSIMDLLLKNGIPSEKIISFIFDDISYYFELENLIEEYNNATYHRNLLNDMLKAGNTPSPIVPCVFWNDTHSLKNLKKDFVREQTTKLLAESIYQKGIVGDVAELGVFKGDFTIVLDELFKDRSLFLYDTFEGFNSDDINSDSTVENAVGESQKFKDTSVEFVKNRIKRDTNLIVKKGYFPDSFNEYNERFSFVSIDFNLYDPVKKALNIMYPLLSEGGYILVSDYNAPFYSGTKRAVDEFSNEFNVSFVPIADFYGSVIISK